GIWIKADADTPGRIVQSSDRDIRLFYQRYGFGFIGSVIATTLAILFTCGPGCRRLVLAARWLSFDNGSTAAAFALIHPRLCR
ncbi:MAG: hypothetical protein MI702_08200, partial [Chlorobiales bacterium]|nr:hypothetical protein [Chlorobiales bacterium]